MKNLAKYIDHTLLKPDATKEEIEMLCKEAKEYDFMSVCVNPSWIEFCKEQLKESNVKVCTVVGFPLGANTLNTKVFEAKEAVSLGADEVDMVINIADAKQAKWQQIQEEVKAVVEGVRSINKNVIVKVILETCLLTKEEIKNASLAAKAAGADFVKTSTGFSTGGATLEDVALMKETVGEQMKVKASGGVSTYEQAIEMIKSGADRIGASKGIAIVTGNKVESDNDY